MKIRIGNDFKTRWAIMWMGEPEDFSDATDISLFFNIYDKKIELTKDVNYTITDNVIEIDCTPDICNILGVYNLELHYNKPNDGFIDGERRSAVDADTFRIVGKSAQESGETELSITTDMAIGFKGDKGDSAYQVWLDAGNVGTEEDYLDWIRQPATDIAETVNLQEQARAEAENTRRNNEEQRVEAEDIRLSSEQSRVEAEALRVTAEDNRVSAETSRATAEAVRVQAEDERETAEATRVSNENSRVTAEQERVNAESLRATAESSRELAESLRVDAEILRQTNTQTAITNAEEATLNANTAAQNANDARLAIQDDLALKANQTDLAQLEGEVSQKANKTQEAWITPTLLNGWVDFSPSYSPVSFYKDSMGVVHLRGTVKSGASGIIFNLPEGYRPSKFEFFLTGTAIQNGTQNGAALYIGGNGNVFTYHATAPCIFLSGITFRAV